MICTQSPAELERRRGDQVKLAGIASSEPIRLMHMNLAMWHHEQLIRKVLA